MKLSLHQMDALAKMRDGGGRIERWQGGFWTIPGTTFKQQPGYRVPGWYAGTATVQALAKLGLIVESRRQPTGMDSSFVVEYRLTS